jgi:hypothetical protein
MPVKTKKQAATYSPAEIQQAIEDGRQLDTAILGKMLLDQTEAAEAAKKETLTIPGDMGISAKARAVLAMLAGQEWGMEVPKYSADIYTYAWYNGREHGVAMVVAKNPMGVPAERERLVFVFGECRNSDSIFLDKWMDTESGICPPTLKDFTEEAYALRRRFEYGAVGKTADAIIKDVRKFLGIKWDY